MKVAAAILKAKCIAQNSNMHFKLGAVLFDNKNFTVGFNRKFGVNCKSRDNCFSIHAEEMCIIKANRIADFDFDLSTLVVVRVNNAGKLMCSLPCKQCMKLINKHGIKNLYYTL